MIWVLLMKAMIVRNVADAIATMLCNIKPPYLYACPYTRLEKVTSKHVQQASSYHDYTGLQANQNSKTALLICIIYDLYWVLAWNER